MLLMNTISDLIELTEHILPLGSLVQLRKQEVILEKNIHMAGFRKQEVEHEC